MIHATTVNTGHLAALLRQHMARLLRLVPRARHGDARGVHQARVASRRLREALPVAGSVLADEARSVRRDIRRLTSALGDVRELDVTQHVLDEELADHAWPGVVVARLRQHLSEERARRARRMRTRIDRVDLDRTATRVDALAAAIDVTPRHMRMDELLGLRLRARARGLARALRAAGTLYVPESLHAVRIAGKKLRYSLELARDAADRPAGRDIDTLRTLQALLGRLHDLQILQAHVHIVAAQAGADRVATRALANMAASVDAECRGLQAKFLKMAPALQALAARANSTRANESTGPSKKRMARIHMTGATRARRAHGA